MLFYGLSFRNRDRSGSGSNVTGDRSSLQCPVHAMEKTLQKVCASEVNFGKILHKGDYRESLFVLFTEDLIPNIMFLDKMQSMMFMTVN